MSEPEPAADERFLPVTQREKTFHGVVIPAGLSADHERQYLAVVRVYTGGDGVKKAGWLKAPNGQPTNLTERQWVIAQTPAGREQCGDWLNLARYAKLAAAPELDLGVGVIKAAAGVTALQAALAWAREHWSPARSFDTEVGAVRIDATTVRDSLGHGYRQAKLDAIASLGEGFARAVHLGSEPDFDGKAISNHYFAYPVRYDGRRCLVFARAREDVNLNRLYVHEVFAEEDIKKADTLQATAGQNEVSKPRRGISLYRNILRDIYAVNPESVKIPLDENGEPVLGGAK